VALLADLVCIVRMLEIRPISFLRVLWKANLGEKNEDEFEGCFVWALHDPARTKAVMKKLSIS